jgi:hypothetical protein
MQKYLGGLVIAVIFLCSFAADAEAQLGGILKKAENAGKKTTKPVDRAGSGANSNGAVVDQKYTVRFSTKPINPNNLQASSFTNSFTGNDPIYGVVIFNEPLKSENVLGDTYSDKIKDLTIGASINEDPNFPSSGVEIQLKVTPQQANSNAFAFVIIPETLPSKTDYDTLKHMLVQPFVEDVINQHKNRNARKFDVRVTAGTEERRLQEVKNIQTGSHFTLDLSGGLGRYKEIASKYDLMPN